jgi:hypothetical protein
MVISPDKPLRTFASTELPLLAASGLDQIAVARDGRVAVRDMSRRQLIVFDSKGVQAIPVQLPNAELTPMGLTWVDDYLFVVDHTGGLWRTSFSESKPVVVRIGNGPTNPIQLTYGDSRVFVVTGGENGSLYTFDPSASEIGFVTFSTGIQGVSAVAQNDRGLWLSEFHGEGLWLLESGGREMIAEGLRAPTSLATAADGSLFVAEFGSDRIVMVLP